MKLAERYTSSDHMQFKVIATYSPNEDNDTWVEYANVLTNQVYTCRLEAFLSRFRPIVN
jgi:hypothetical protein